MQNYQIFFLKRNSIRDRKISVEIKYAANIQALHLTVLLGMGKYCNVEASERAL